MNWSDWSWTLVWLSAFDELQIIWNDVKATLSGNVLILEKTNLDTTPPETTSNISSWWINTDLDVILIAEDNGWWAW